MKAVNNYDMAYTYVMQGRPHLAEEPLIKALGENPNDAQSLYLLGTIYLQLGRTPLAVQLLVRAVQIMPDFVEAWNNLGQAYNVLTIFDGAEKCWNEGLKIDKFSNGKKVHSSIKADFYNNLGTIHINKGTPEKGLELFNKSLSLNPEHGDAHWNRALINLELGKYGEGFDEYHWGFKTKIRNMRQYGNIPEWDGSDGKSLIVWGEQGVGDEIMFGTIIPELAPKCKEVILDCHPRMETLFKNTFKDYKNVFVYGTRKADMISWLGNHKPDAKIIIGELGKYFRRNIEAFHGNPYLKAVDERRKYYRDKLDKIDSRPKIGISWKGGLVKTNSKDRSITLEQLLPILRQNATFISLQYNEDSLQDIAEFESEHDIHIYHWPKAVQRDKHRDDDYHETAALISELDLVITVNNTVHHTAGALGIPCWTMTPKAKAWRYYSPNGSKNPWYNSVCQVEQKENGKWDDVIQEITKELNKYLTQKEAINDRRC